MSRRVDTADVSGRRWICERCGLTGSSDTAAFRFCALTGGDCWVVPFPEQDAPTDPRTREAHEAQPPVRASRVLRNRL